MTAHSFASAGALAIAAVGLLCAGCTSQPGRSAIASAASSSPAPTASPSPLESPVATLTASPPIEPSTEPTPASPGEPAMPEPPAASLAVEGGDPVVGELGSFSWKNSGSDAPWVPGTSMHVGRGEELTLTLATDVRIERWTVSRTPGATFGSGVVGIAEGSAQRVAFTAPPRGSWSVNVQVRFGDNLGSAAYYWLITVD